MKANIKSSSVRPHSSSEHHKKPSREEIVEDLEELMRQTENFQQSLLEKTFKVSSDIAATRKYEPLLDESLKNYFRIPSVDAHLKKLGLVPSYSIKLIFILD